MRCSHTHLAVLRRLPATVLDAESHPGEMPDRDQSVARRVRRNGAELRGASGVRRSGAHSLRVDAGAPQESPKSDSGVLADGAAASGFELVADANWEPLPWSFRYRCIRRANGYC